MSEKRNRKNTNKWFNRECYERRKEYNKSRNSFIRNKSTKNKLKLFWKEIKSQYKQSSEESQTLNTNDMYTHFNQLYGSESTEHDDQEATNYEIDDNDLDITFTQKN